MVRWIKSLSAKRGLIAAWIALAAAVVFAAGQYNAKEKYTAYVSYRLDADMRRFVERLEIIDQAYADVLEEGTISSRQRNLFMLHEDLANIIRDYRELAVRLGLRDESFRYDQSTVNAMKIVRYFNVWEDEETVELDPPTRERIAVMREFVGTWLAAVDRDVPSYRVNDDSWLRLLDAIETNTIAFLAGRRIDALDDLWLDRTEIR